MNPDPGPAVRATPEPAHPQPPAPPAEEETMPKGIPIAGRRKACEECQSPTRHRKRCSKAAGAKVEKAERKVHAHEIVARLGYAAERMKAVPMFVASEFEAMSVPDLIRARDEAQEQVKAITGILERRADEIAKALGRAA